VILVAGMARAAERRKQEEADAAAAPPVKGTVVFGGNSRVLMQFDDDSLDVFYVLEIVNSARSRVDIGGPLILDLPTRATGATVMEGSSPQAAVNGTRVTVRGPFASGMTPVQIGFNLPYRSSELTFEQAWPAALEQVTVGVEKVAGLSMTSSQLAATNEVRSQAGTVFLLGTGPGLQPGTPLAVTLSNLPARSQTARYVALGLALAIAGIGIWLAVKPHTAEADARAALVARRDTLLSSLAQLESKRRAGEIGPDKYAARRGRLMGELELIYGELDDAGAGPQGGGEGVAA
jgi:hypothetical protein